MNNSSGRRGSVADVPHPELVFALPVQRTGQGQPVFQAEPIETRLILLQSREDRIADHLRARVEKNVVVADALQPVEKPGHYRAGFAGPSGACQKNSRAVQPERAAMGEAHALARIVPMQERPQRARRVPMAG